MSPRGEWRVPGLPAGQPPIGGRPAKGGDRIAVRLSTAASEALAALRARRGLTITQAVEQALLATAPPADQDPSPGAAIGS